MSKLEELRKQMDVLNEEIIERFAKRIALAIEIAKVKKQESLPVYDPVREKAQREMLWKLAHKTGLSPAVVDEIFALFVEYSKMKMRIEMHEEGDK